MRTAHLCAILRLEDPTTIDHQLAGRDRISRGTVRVALLDTLRDADVPPTIRLPILPVRAGSRRMWRPSASRCVWPQMRCTQPILEMARSLRLLTRPDLRRPARVHAFVDFAAAELAAHKAAFEASAA